MPIDPSNLVERIERLERDGRRVRRVSFTVAAAGVLFGLAGMAAPKLCDTLSAERLVLRDPSGKQRIVADAYGGSPTFSMLSKEGRALAKIGLAQDGEPYFAFYDAKGAEKGTWKGTTTAPAAPETKGACAGDDRTAGLR